MSPWFWLYLWIRMEEEEEDEGKEETESEILFYGSLWEILHPYPELIPCFGCDGWHDEPELEINSDWEDDGDPIVYFDYRIGLKVPRISEKVI